MNLNSFMFQEDYNDVPKPVRKNLQNPADFCVFVYRLVWNCNVWIIHISTWKNNIIYMFTCKKILTFSLIISLSFPSWSTCCKQKFIT